MIYQIDLGRLSSLLQWNKISNTIDQEGNIIKLLQQSHYLLTISLKVTRKIGKKRTAAATTNIEIEDTF